LLNLSIITKTLVYKLENHKLPKDKVDVYIKELNNELSRLLNFWVNHVFDSEINEMIPGLSMDGQFQPKTHQSLVSISRCLWSFSRVYNYNSNSKCLSIAHQLYESLLEHFYDKKHGGFFWSIESNGTVHDSKKQAYGHGFVLYAFSEYYKTTKLPDVLSKAEYVYKIIIDQFYDEQNRGFWEAKNQDWSNIKDMRLSQKDENYPKSMNTHLHILEPFTNLYRVAPSGELKKQIEKLIDLFCNQIIDSETGHLRLFFSEDWIPSSKTVSFGHEIEASWLIHEAAHIVGNKELLERFRNSTLRLTYNTLRYGFDYEKGGIYNELSQNHLDTSKDWWAQAEALVGFLDAFIIKSDEVFFDAFEQTWNNIKNDFIDHVNGEWHWRVDENNRVDTSLPKVGFWKNWYHNSRALIESIERLEQLKNTDDE